VRLGFIGLAVMDPVILMQSDQTDYIRLANLVNLHGLGAAFGAERMPGYPLFLAACSWFVSGGKSITDTFGVSTLLLAVIAQNCLAVAAIFLLYRIGGMINRTTANLAGGFAALNLNMAVYSSQILTDALFYPVFAGFLYLLLRYHESGRTRHLALVAVALGLATMVRSVAMYLPLVLIPYLLFFPRHADIPERGKRLVLFLAILAVLLSPWLMRNYLLYSHAVLTTQGQGHIVRMGHPGDRPV